MTSEHAMAGSTAATSFPAFPQLAVEIQLMIWEAFAKAEAASRIVPVSVSRCPVSNRAEQFPDVDAHAQVDNEDFEWPVLSLLPLKRLASPLFRVCARSRGVALKRYPTCIRLYEVPAPLPRIRQPYAKWLAGTSNHWWRRRWDRTQRPARFFHPLVVGTDEIWVDREEYCIEVEDSLTSVAVDELQALGLADMRADSSDASGQPGARPHCRGCVYLDLETDRFVALAQWFTVWPYDESRIYGFRELSDALRDFKYHGIPFDGDFMNNILARRPPALRYASAYLSDKVRTGIRHVVFPSERPGPDPDPRCGPWRVVNDGPTTANERNEERKDIAAITTPGTHMEGPGQYWFWPWTWAWAFPGAIGGAPTIGTKSKQRSSSPATSSSASASASKTSNATSIWGFRASTEVYRAFFDDLEAKGPEQLHIQRAIKTLIEPQSYGLDTSDWPEEWELVWGSELWDQ